jgi:hypothetical protein
MEKMISKMGEDIIVQNTLLRQEGLEFDSLWTQLGDERLVKRALMNRVKALEDELEVRVKARQDEVEAQFQTRKDELQLQVETLQDNIENLTASNRCLAEPIMRDAKNAEDAREA